jgi:hypothetical protein
MAAIEDKRQIGDNLISFNLDLDAEELAEAIAALPKSMKSSRRFELLRRALPKSLAERLGGRTLR